MTKEQQERIIKELQPIIQATKKNRYKDKE